MRIRTGSDCNPVGLIQYPEQCLKPPSISLIHKNLMNTKHPEDTIMWHHLARGSTCNGNSQARQNYHHSCIHMYRKQPVSSEMTTMITYIHPLIRNFDTIHKMCLLPMVQIPCFFFRFFKCMLPDTSLALALYLHYLLGWKLWLSVSRWSSQCDWSHKGSRFCSCFFSFFLPFLCTNVILVTVRQGLWYVIL